MSWIQSFELSLWALWWFPGQHGQERHPCWSRRRPRTGWRWAGWECTSGSGSSPSVFPGENVPRCMWTCLAEKKWTEGIWNYRWGFMLLRSGRFGYFVVVFGPLIHFEKQKSLFYFVCFNALLYAKIIIIYKTFFSFITFITGILCSPRLHLFDKK